MVGAEGFEPPTLCSQSRCATRLRYAPTCAVIDPMGGFGTPKLYRSDLYPSGPQAVV